MREQPIRSGEPASDSDSNTLTRRTLVGGAATLVTTALAGCSSLSFGDESEPELGFEPSELPQSVVTTFPQRPSAYPGPVPDGLAERHRDRARALLDDVPADPSFPNGMTSEQLEDERESASERVREGSESTGQPLDRLGHWRYARGTAAEVWGAYHAAAGEIDAEAVASRREQIRRELARFEMEWSAPGVDGVEALALGYPLEELRTQCRRFLVPEARFPDEPDAAVFRVGSLVAGVERARAALADLTGLRQAYADSASSTESHRSKLSMLTRRVHETVSVSRRQVEPHLGGSVNYSTFERDIEGLPAAELFLRLHGLANHTIADAEEARHRGNDARAVVYGARALVAILALTTASDAIREGEYGMPDSVEAVKTHRKTALSALERTRSIDPDGLATLLAAPTWREVDEDSYVFRQLTDRDAEPDQRDVVQLVAAFGATTHLARAVPEVVDRLLRELENLDEAE